MNPITIQPVADKYIRFALEEDINSEDVFTNSVMPGYKKGEVQSICREDGIIAGLQIFERVFTLLDPGTKVVFDVRDGEEVKRGQHLVTVTEDIHVLLSGERTTLNYPQRLSGIATYTHTVAGMFEDTGTRFLDTRKTISYIRIFEKYAVRIGGGQNRRYGLSDGVLLRDNYIDAAGGVGEVVIAVKAYALFVRRTEVETEDPDMAKEAVDAGIDTIMPGSMMPEQMVKAIRYISGQVETEYSGSMTKGDIRTITELGVDYVSSGALTHSPLILGISLKHPKVLTDQTVAMFCRRE